ncbi:hypothetical protein ACSVDA_14290 [Cytobacillus sp. Hm23]
MNKKKIRNSLIAGLILSIPVTQNVQAEDFSSQANQIVEQRLQASEHSMEIEDGVNIELFATESLTGITSELFRSITNPLSIPFGVSANFDILSISTNSDLTINNVPVNAGESFTVDLDVGENKFKIETNNGTIFELIVVRADPIAQERDTLQKRVSETRSALVDKFVEINGSSTIDSELISSVNELINNYSNALNHLEVFYEDNDISNEALTNFKNYLQEAEATLAVLKLEKEVQTLTDANLSAANEALSIAYTAVSQLPDILFDEENASKASLENRISQAEESIKLFNNQTDDAPASLFLKAVQQVKDFDWNAQYDLESANVVLENAEKQLSILENTDEDLLQQQEMIESIQFLKQQRVSFEKNMLVGNLEKFNNANDLTIVEGNIEEYRDHTNPLGSYSQLQQSIISSAEKVQDLEAFYTEYSIENNDFVAELQSINKMIQEAKVDLFAKVLNLRIQDYIDHRHSSTEDKVKHMVEGLDTTIAIAEDLVDSSDLLAPDSESITNLITAIEQAAIVLEGQEPGTGVEEPGTGGQEAQIQLFSDKVAVIKNIDMRSVLAFVNGNKKPVQAASKALLEAEKALEEITDESVLLTLVDDIKVLKEKRLEFQYFLLESYFKLAERDYYGIDKDGSLQNASLRNAYLNSLYDVKDAQKTLQDFYEYRNITNDTNKYKGTLDTINIVIAKTEAEIFSKELEMANTIDKHNWESDEFYASIKNVDNISELVERAQEVVESLDSLGLSEQKSMLINSIENINDEQTMEVDLRMNLIFEESETGFTKTMYFPIPYPVTVNAHTDILTFYPNSDITINNEIVVQAAEKVSVDLLLGENKFEIETTDGTVYEIIVHRG